LATGQEDLLGGIHLPDFMRPLGPAGIDGGLPPGGGRSKLGAEEPALQGAFGGRGPIGEAVAQHHADQARSPGGMLGAEAYSRLHNRSRGLGCLSAARSVGGFQGRRTLLPKASDQAPDGAWVEAQGRGDSAGVLAILGAPPDGLAHGHGEWTSHGRSSIQSSKRRAGS
jgi:hypothetical protein